MLLLLGGFQAGYAEGDPVNGEVLFKANCARCHSTNLTKDLTGPALQGAVERAPSRELLVKWIRNSGGVLASKESSYYQGLFEKWNKVAMNSFLGLEDQQIDDIISWVENWTPPADAGGEGAIDIAKADEDEGLNSLWNWIRLLIFAIVVLLLNIAGQIARLRGVDFFQGIDWNKLNGRIFMGFLVLGMIGAFWSAGAFRDTYLLTNAASEHGAEIDTLFWVTMVVVFTVFVVTNILLFYFSFKYAGREGRKAKYYPENHKLELIWTVVPAIVLTVLVLFGIRTWNNTMGAPDEKEQLVGIELNAEQFAWTIRYPGEDAEYGPIDVRLIGSYGGTNVLGIDFSTDQSRDDFMSDTLFLPLGRRVDLSIRSRDVLHSVYLPHFRVKMDAVPGMYTRFHFVPTITTDSMRSIKQDTTFNYELACTEVCGASHWNMRKVVVVLPAEEWDRWHARQKEKTYYSALQLDGKDEEFIKSPGAKLRADNTIEE